jgi:hypothetical protein
MKEEQRRKYGWSYLMQNGFCYEKRTAKQNHGGASAVLVLE